jgi:dihydroorotate dehydrogenase
MEDYLKTAALFEKANLGDYYEINISCPNAFGGEPFTTPHKLEKLLFNLDKLKLTKPVFIKMPIELSNAEADGLLKVILKHQAVGVIFGNLAKDRSNKALNKKELKNTGKGNFSGKPTWEQSNRLIAFAYKKYGKKLIVVGCGGVFSAEDAYHKIKLGASLVELITGMVFEGPQLIGEINRGLVTLLEKDGYKNIHEAIGASNK